MLPIMFLPGFRDLVKPQWVAVIEELKLSGGLSISELSRRLELAYMTVKQHCEELTKLGYVERTRIPRTQVGRPEIFHRLSPKADALFPQAGVSLTLDLLEASPPQPAPHGGRPPCNLPPRCRSPSDSYTLLVV